MKLNTKPRQIKTHEGGVAKRINPELQLKRSVMACMLWEDSFYEDGASIADRIVESVGKVSPLTAMNVAIECRNKMKLRHVPLLIAREMARTPKHKHLVARLLAEIIQRPDELTEFMAIYWKDEKQPLSAQVKKGLAKAFIKFDEYQLAKYNRDGEIKLKDVLFLCHAKPKDKEQEEMWGRLINNTLKTPDTWETSLSSGGDKKLHWERLISQNRLGAMAYLRNLRNMMESEVDVGLIREGLRKLNPSRVLPFRFISAAIHAPILEPELEELMLNCLKDMQTISGETVLLLDVSASMQDRISGRSEISRLDAACGLAILLREVCESIRIYTFSMSLVEVPARRGFALRDGICNSQTFSGTPLGIAVESIYAPREQYQDVARFGYHGLQKIDFRGQNLNPDRLIVLTDEQSSGGVPDPKTGKGYMINVSSYKNGVGYGPWLHVDGWSESIVDYISELERSNYDIK